MRLSSIRSLPWWRERICREEWNVGVVQQSAEDIVRRGIVGRVDWLSPGPGKMLADPNCTPLEDGRSLLLAECMDFRTRRGEIWSAIVRPDERLAEARLRPFLAARVHLSYPFVSIDNAGRRRITLEASETGGLHAYREDRGGFALADAAMLRGPATDATLWRHGDRWWLFCGFADDRPNERLHLFGADDLDGPWTPHPANPIKADASSSRPAGPLFRADGVLIRPAQDCSRTYGGAVILHAVRRLDPDGYEEEPIRRLGPVGPRFPHGLHTVCPAGPVTLIDGKRLAFRPDELLHRPLARWRSRSRIRRAHGTAGGLPARAADPD